MDASLVVSAGASTVDMKRGETLAAFWKEAKRFVCWGAGLNQGENRYIVLETQIVREN